MNIFFSTLMIDFFRLTLPEKKAWRKIGKKEDRNELSYKSLERMNEFPTEEWKC